VRKYSLLKKEAYKVAGSIALGVLLLFPLLGFAIDESVRRLVDMETLRNATASRSNKPIPLEHYEIPLKIIKQDISERMPPKVRDALIFTKDGEEYVRWILNPEDTKFRFALRRFLQKNKIRADRKKHFTAYQTASRSYIVEDPFNGAQFSLKVSTNNTGGMWKDKKQTAVDTREVRMINDYLYEVGRKMPFENFVLMDEPAAFQIDEIDQGMLVRVLGDLPEKKKYYVPGFSAVNHNAGIELARINGSLNPKEFWNTHYNKPLARALGELAAKTGITYDSPHSQNFLVELDENNRPTGRIVLRDLGDSNLVGDVFEAHGKENIVKAWDASAVRKRSFKSHIGIFHGTPLPGWMDEGDFTQWGKDFFAEYNKEYARITGLSMESLPTYIEVNGRYLASHYDLKGEEWEKYLNNIREGKMERAAKVIPWRAAARCQEEFAKVSP